MVWEELISLNAGSDPAVRHLEPPGSYRDQDNGSIDWGRETLSVEAALDRDVSVLPRTEDREGYYGPNHFLYWASGLRDALECSEWMKQRGERLDSVLDLGCASGRVIRHFHYQAGLSRVFGCDINRAHVDWINACLPAPIVAFQNTSLPHLPLPDASLDLVTAFSVFTHVEAFDTAWLMEIRRILRPGGVAWLTIHGDRTWSEIQPNWPLYPALQQYPEYRAARSSPIIPKERLVFRLKSQGSYSSQVFYRYDYIQRHWGRYLNFLEIRPTRPKYQDVVILQKEH